MNRPLRVLMIGRHFWPHGSIDSAGFLFELACGLHRRGVHVEVLTPRYASSWPETFEIREIRVHRPAAAPRSDWSMGRYVRHLTTWMRANAKSFDVLFVDSIREEACAAIEAARSLGCATALRVGGWGMQSDTQWWQLGRGARKCGSVGRMADAVVTKCAVDERALIAEGYDSRRIHRIDQGFRTGGSAASACRHVARRALGLANSDLITQDDTPVVVCASRMTRDGGVNHLARAARNLVNRYPDLRLWFIGDGPHRESMFDYLRGEGVRASIAMPGSFCDPSEVLAAADLYLQLDDDGLDHFLPSAIAAAIPIAAVDNASTRFAIAGAASDRGSKPTEIDELVQWISGSTTKLTRIAVSQVLDDLPARKELANQLRRHLLRTRPQSAAIEAYVQLMESVARERSSAGRDSSVEAVS